MPAPLVIAAKDLRQRFRDRSVLLLGFVAPLVISALMSLAFQATQNVHATVAVVDLDRGPVAAAFLHALHAPDLASILAVTSAGSESQARAEVKGRRVGAAIVVPRGFSAGALGPHPRDLVTITSVNDTVAADIASSVADTFVAQLDADRLSVLTAAHRSHLGPAQVAQLSAQVSRLSLPVQTVFRPVDAKPLKTISYYAPSMAIFFLMFTITFTSRSFFVERAEGTLERVLAAPIHAMEVLVGKVLSVFVYGVASLGTVAVVTSLLFGADWGYPPAAAVVSLAMVISVMCLTALVIGLARTQRQAEGISSVVVFGLVLLGGNFVFISVEPPYLQRLALLTPNGWALRAYTDLATSGGGMSVVTVPVLAILAFSALVAAVAALFSRRAVSL